MDRNVKEVMITSGSDFHAYDWYQAYKKLRRIDVILDSETPGNSRNYFESEKYRLLRGTQGLLSKHYGRFNDIVRNIIKLISLPLVVYQISREKEFNIYWAHGLFFGLCLSLTKHRFVLTPQGSELLVRPGKSHIYRLLAKWIVHRSARVTVDSMHMKVIAENFGGKVELVQNGVNLDIIQSIGQLNKSVFILSPRGFTSLYRIKEILEEVQLLKDVHLTLCYPFEDLSYSNALIARFKHIVQDLGTLISKDYLKILARTRYVISIPNSDSSPKSIYEAIFLGCIIITNENAAWMENCTQAMKARIITANISRKGWLRKAIEAGEKLPDQFEIDFETNMRFSREENVKKLIQILHYEVL